MGFSSYTQSQPNLFFELDSVMRDQVAFLEVPSLISCSFYNKNNKSQSFADFGLQKP